MKIKTLSATFGRLEGHTLTLSQGLNIIEAGNESGKSTWMTFLRVMLYGLNTRDRSPHADKHRFLPWSGSPMQGRIDLIYNDENITIRRSTARANSPMGAFAAEYTDTTTPVPYLMSTTSGETLLGVPQDVFERSAFIRQSGVPIDQSSALEQRIASLITTGDETSSYTAAAEQLRKQLTRRRYNKTGLLPQLENEIAALGSTLSEITALNDTALRCQSELDTLIQRDSYLSHQLHLLDAADNVHRAARLDAARRELTEANAVYNDASARAAHLPPRNELTTLTGEIAAMDTLTSSVQSAHERVCELDHILEQAQKKLEAHPFSPQTPDEIAATLISRPPRPAFAALLLFFTAILCATLLSVLHDVLKISTIPTPTRIALISAISSAVVGCFLSLRRKRYAAKHSKTQTDLDTYTILYKEAEEIRATHRTAADTHRTLSEDYKLHLNRILSSVQQFSHAQDLNEAHRAIENAFSLYTALDTATQTRKQAQLRLDLLAENTPDLPALPAEPPALSRAQAESERKALQAQLAELQRRIHTVQGRAQALGDPILIRADLEQMHTRHAQLSKEYDAISLAQTVLSNANTTMQNRFSPALGEKAASIFTKLTKGKYNKVLLDRKLIPSAQECGALLSHEVHSLSQGAADQLYLAVRLAICDLLLPAENGVPIFLDDALITFDDERMAAALDLLVELSEHRQILLFTCQHRELAYLRTAHPDRYHAVTLSENL